LPLDRVGEKWFYECVILAKLPRVRILKKQELSVVSGEEKSVHKEENVIPNISVDSPIGSGGFKGFLGMLRQFVAVGGDFV